MVNTLIIYGANDALTKLGISKRIHDLLPNSTLHLIEDEAHFPHEGAPNEMNALILSWLNKVKREHS